MRDINGIPIWNSMVVSYHIAFHYWFVGRIHNQAHGEAHFCGCCFGNRPCRYGGHKPDLSGCLRQGDGVPARALVRSTGLEGRPTLLICDVPYRPRARSSERLIFLVCR